MVAALFVQRGGCYWDLEGVDPWDEERDARTYAGPWPVVAHPPCNLWVNFAAVNWRRYRRQLPAWYPGGSDGGCFAAALSAARQWGGVLEHPAESHAWAFHGLPSPVAGGWLRAMCGGWVCEVSQSAYGHRARKRTWLYFSGAVPPPLRWESPKGECQIGWFDRLKPTLCKKAASATPPAFRDVLLAMARSAKGGGQCNPSAA